MGLAKEQLLDVMEETRDRKIARNLGITYEEFAEYHTDIDTEESSEGLVYNYIIHFSEDIPQNIWDKIKGSKGDHSVIVPAHIFDNL